MFREKFTVLSFILPKITEVLNLVSMKKKVNHFQPESNPQLFPWNFPQITEPQKRDKNPWFFHG